MPRVAIIGGGFAGLAAAAALGDSGYRANLYESRGFLGGRATSYPVPRRTRSRRPSTIASTSCCAAASICWTSTGAWASTMRSVSSRSSISSSRAGGRQRLRAGLLPAPLHFTESFLSLKFLNAGRQNRGGARDPAPSASESSARTDLDRITMLDWLREKRQTAARDRAVLAPGAGERDQRGTGPHGGAARVSGVPAGISGAHEFL